jgi:hypothetical protein
MLPSADNDIGQDIEYSVARVITKVPTFGASIWCYTCDSERSDLTIGALSTMRMVPPGPAPSFPVRIGSIICRPASHKRAGVPCTGAGSDPKLRQRRGSHRAGTNGARTACPRLRCRIEEREIDKCAEASSVLDRINSPSRRRLAVSIHRDKAVDESPKYSACESAEFVQEWPSPCASS